MAKYLNYFKKKKFTLLNNFAFGKITAKQYLTGFTLLLVLIIVLTGTFFLKANLLSEKLELRKIITFLNNKISVLGQELTAYSPYYFPRYPQRLMYLASEITSASEEVTGLNEELNSSVRECDCKLAQSRCELKDSVCRPVGTFGEICPEVEKIEEKKEKIRESANQLSFLQNLLEKEMESGLKRELETLRPEVAEELKSNLEKLLNVNQEIIERAEDNRNLSLDCSVKNCQSACQQQEIFKMKACLIGKAGEQKPITLRFKAGVRLDDLKLGEVKISSIRLDLPKELQLPKLPKLSPLTISLSDIVINYPEVKIDEIKEKEILDFALAPITFNIPQPSLPLPPEITLSCPQQTTPSTYQYPSKGYAATSSKETDWYLKTFEWLSQLCVDFPGMRDQWEIPATTTECFDEEGKPITEPEGCALMERCFIPEKVAPTIITLCDKAWETYLTWMIAMIPPPEPTTTCKLIGAPATTTRNEAAIDRCCELFKKEKEPICVPPTPVFWYFPPSPPVLSDCDTDPIETLKEKCTQIRESGRAEIPEQCKLLSLFTGKIEAPAPEEFIGQAETYPSSKIIDYSPGFCPPSFPTIPKISLPSIIIPDIKLPDFKLLPFIDINLPDLIFEDLVFPEIELCNLDDCQNMFPYLSLRLPALVLPTIEIPPIQLPDLQIFVPELGPLRVVLPEVRINPFQLPAIPFTLPQLPELSLLSLTMPELELPSIPSPRPKLFFTFEGVDIDVLGILLGFLKAALGIPDIDLCIEIGLKLGIPLRLGLEDFIFAWPAFPRIPQIPFCKDIRNFCLIVKTSLGEVTNKTKEIEEVLNNALQKGVQAKLDQLAPLIKEEIEKNINERLRQVEQKINEKLKYPQPAKVEDGLLKISPIIIPGEDITTPEIDLAKLIDFPEKIPIPWPEKLKKINLTTPLVYDLPDIPLSQLSYSKEFRIKLPGFRTWKLSYDISGLKNYPACLSKKPTGGNPCPTAQIQSNLGKIENLKVEIFQTSQNIIKILE